MSWTPYILPTHKDLNVTPAHCLSWHLYCATWPCRFRSTSSAKFVNQSPLSTTALLPIWPVRILTWANVTNTARKPALPSTWPNSPVSTCPPQLLCSCMKLWVERSTNTSRLWSSTTLQPTSARCLNYSRTALASCVDLVIWSTVSPRLTPGSPVVQLSSQSIKSHCPSSTINSKAIIFILLVLNSLPLTISLLFSPGLVLTVLDTNIT